MSDDSLSDRVKTTRARAGFSRTEVVGAIEIAGDDRVSFLQTQLPVDVTLLEPGQGAYTATLDRRGRIEADLTLLNLGPAFLALLPLPRIEAVLAKLGSFVFRERVTLADRTADLAVLELHGPAVPEILANLGAPGIPTAAFGHVIFDLAGAETRFLFDPWTGDPGGRLLLPRSERSTVVESLERAMGPAGGAELDEAALEVLRIEGGRARYGLEMDERTLLPELGRPEMFSLNKGCYLGQETVERIRSRGRVNRRLTGLRVEGQIPPAPGDPVILDEATVGEVRGACFSPSLNGPVALAWLRAETAEPGAVVRLRVGGRLVPARVASLPLYRSPGPEEVAEELYREGTAAFTEDRYEDAGRLFERALLMNPGHTGALEALGVSQERRGRLDEAIETMRSLAELEPDHIMAWTNLSRYHALAGDIEEAERIKGHVSYLVMNQRMGEKIAERRAEEDEARRGAEREERMALFGRVLELDPGDVVANFGLGKIYLDLERYEEAALCFERAAAGQKDYSMAFSHLGTCLAALGRASDAADALRAGIEAATKRGDLVPKADMTRRLEALEADSG